MTEVQKPTRKVAQTPKPPRLVKMRREDGKTADVHPDMVEDYRKGGFTEDRKGIKLMRSAREAADDVSTPLMDD